MNSPATRFEYFEIRPCVEHDGDVHSFMGKLEWCATRGANIHTPENALIEAEAHRDANEGSKLFWTLYGVNTGQAVSIGDYNSYENALTVMNAILAPIADARDTMLEFANTKLGAIAHELDDIIGQSSNPERI